jgi:hypothetical protein
VGVRETLSLVRGGAALGAGYKREDTAVEEVEAADFDSR